MAAAPQKRQRQNPCTPEAAASTAPIEWTLPADLLLEIVARSDIRTFIRCAATCKLLRRDMLNPSFIRRVTQQGGIVPSCILTYLNIHDAGDLLPHLSLVHPATPTAISFIDDSLAPFVSRTVNDLLREYYPVTSRGGLVLLCHRHPSRRRTDMCVYDPITGQCTFLPKPPVTPDSVGCIGRCVLLTAADNIECYFLLFVGTLSSNGRAIKIQTFASSTSTWRPVMTHDGFFLQKWPERPGKVIVLPGGIIHWLSDGGGEIITYDVRTAEPGQLEVPVSAFTNFKRGRLYLGSYSSPVGCGSRLLRLFCVDGFTISMWHQLYDGGGWALETVIDVGEKVRSLDPDIPADRHLRVTFVQPSKRSTIVFLHINLRDVMTGFHPRLVVLDLETKEIRVMQRLALFSKLYEIDLPSRLRSMKIFL